MYIYIYYTQPTLKKGKKYMHSISLIETPFSNHVNDQVEDKRGACLIRFKLCGMTKK